MALHNNNMNNNNNAAPNTPNKIVNNWANLSGVLDVKTQFGSVYQQEMVRRRNRLFLLMLACFLSIIVSLVLDAWVYHFLNRHAP
jgi:hypothetical protein